MERTVSDNTRITLTAGQLRRLIMEESDGEDRSFRPTVEWMREHYDDLNRRLFNGALGDCEFEVFKTGRGSGGGVLGWFRITGDDIRVGLRSRQMFADRADGTVYIDAMNFVELCRPMISINGNYSGKEHSFLNTLLHEMCHYFTYRNGYCPRQGHGKEFRAIAERVCAKSKGEFSVQRTASAEDMKSLELDAEIKDRIDRKLDMKKARLKAVVCYMANDVLRVTTTSSERLVDEIVSQMRRNPACAKVVVTGKKAVLDILFDERLIKDFRSYRFWEVTWKFPWRQAFESAVEDASWEDSAVRHFDQSILDRMMDWRDRMSTRNVAEDSAGEEAFVEIDPDDNLGLESPLESL